MQWELPYLWIYTQYTLTVIVWHLDGMENAGTIQDESSYKGLREH